MKDVIGLVLGIVNQVRAQGASIAVQGLTETAPTLEVKAQEVALQCGVTDGVLIDDMNLRVQGFTLADLAKPGPELLTKLTVPVRHLAVRISRDWMNAALDRVVDKELKAKGVDRAELVFPPERSDLLLIKASVKGLAVEVTIRLGLSGNKLLVVIDGVRLLGLLPVPKWVRELVFWAIRSKLENLPGVKYHEGQFEMDPLPLSPVPVQTRFLRLATRGRYLVFEAGEV